AMTNLSSYSLILLSSPARPCTPFPYTTLFRSALGARHFCGVAAEEVIHGLFGRQPRDRRQDAECVGGQEDDIAAMSTHAGHHGRSEEHTSELQSRRDVVCSLLLENKKTTPPSV